jgi:hypothetical protein
MTTKTTWTVIRNTIRRNSDDQSTAIWAVIDHLDRHGRMVGHTASHDDLIEALDSLETTLAGHCTPSMSPADADKCAAAEAAVVAAAEACPEVVCERLAGESFDDDDVVAALDRCDFRGWWPVIDGDRCLTGDISEGDGEMLNVDDEAMIHAADARAAGWRIDTEEGTAAPSEPVTVEFATANETIGWNAGLREMAPSDHPAQADACAAYRRAAIIALADDDRASRLDVEAPKNGRTLHSQWCGAHWGYSAGAIGTMGRDLTSDERAAIDAAHEAGLEAARKVIEAEDASAPRLMDYHTNEDIRAATAEEIDASADAGPEGVILLAADGSILRADDAGADAARRVYVQNDD